MCSKQKVPWKVLGFDREGETFVGATVLPMGWSSAVGVMQHAHRRLALHEEPAMWGSWLACKQWNPSWQHFSKVWSGGRFMVTVPGWHQRDRIAGWEVGQRVGRTAGSWAVEVERSLRSLGCPNQPWQDGSSSCKSGETGCHYRWERWFAEGLNEKGFGGIVFGYLDPFAGGGATESFAGVLWEGSPHAAIPKATVWSLWLHLESNWRWRWSGAAG